MENIKFCQSCAMPMMNDEVLGTNSDRSKNEDYCIYCFMNGAFTKDCTMDEMIEICVPHMVENNPNMTEDEARAAMKVFLPKLKRWR